MSDKPDGGPAFPRSINETYDRVNDGIHPQEGMTLRDYFAGQALAGHLAATSAQALSEMATNPEKAKPYMLHVSTLMYLYADAMIAARDK